MESSARLHAEQLAWRQESWASIELRVSCQITLLSDRGGPTPDFDSHVDHYIETAAGQRKLDSQSLKDGIVKYRSVYYFDGRLGASVAHDRENPDREQQIILHRHFGLENRGVTSSRPAPLLHEWVGLTPLSEALSTARSLGSSQVIGRDCDVFLFSHLGPTGNQQRVYHLDQVTSVPLKVVYYLTEADRLADRAYQEWTANEVSEVQGYPIVLRATQLDYSQSEDPSQPSRARQYQVESITFNQDYPASTFRPAYDPGAIVFDTVTKQDAYRIPGETEAASATSSSPPAVTHSAMPIRAEIPRPWTTYTAPVSLGLGLCILVAGFLLWRHRSS